MKGLIANIPWGIGYRSEKFGLVSLDDSYVGLSSTSPSIRSKLRNFTWVRERMNMGGGSLGSLPAVPCYLH